MPARLSKRQQRQLQDLSPPDAVADESDQDRLPAKTAFAALVNDLEPDDDESASESAPKSKKAKKKKKKDSAATPAVARPAPDTTVGTRAPADVSPPVPASPSGPSKKEWKALKKAKAKEKRSEKDDIDKALEELAIKYPDLSEASTSSAGKQPVRRSLANDLHTLLAVSINHLDTEAEMRKFFGAKVVSGSNRAAAGSATARRQPTTQRSNLTKPKPNWWPAKLREGLTLRALTDEELQSKVTRSLWTDDNERWWTMEYSKRYKGVTRMFLQVVLSGDPEGLYAIIRQVPWHADALLQLAELYSHREEHSQAADFIERAMFTYERAFVGAFTFTSGTNRLDFDHVENRPFFLSLHRQVIDLQRRGVVRTAFEFARLLYSLDPWSDPHGALLHLDFLAIKAGMHQWLLDLVDVFECSTRIEDKDQPQAPALALPGVAYAVALAWRAKNAEAEATAALKHAVIEFPSIVTLLADKADISLPAEVRSHPAFRVYTRDSSAATEQSLLHLLSHLYVQRSHGLWKDPKQSSWFVETVGQVVRAGELPSTALGSKGHQYMRNLARTPAFPVSIYRHVMVLGSSAQRLLAYIPAQVASLNSLACDPLPPPTRVSMYDDEFFRGSEDAFTGAAGGQRGQAANARMLERLVPDPLMRRQLQEFFDGHPRLLQLFPGGVVQFAQVAGNLPEDVLQELMLAQVMQEEGGAAHGGMPGGMPGEDMVALEFLEEFDNGQADGDDNEVERDHEHRDLDPDAEAGTEDEDEDEEDEDEDEEVAPMPVRVLRNIFNRFWGGGAAQDADSEESEEDGEIALDDVD